jgi:hypothetical protein
MTQPGGATDSLGGTGADGIVFVLKAIGTPSLGDPGSGMGYLGLGQNSIGIAFDTWYNPELGDISSNHVGIDESYTVLAQQNVTPDFNNGNVWYTWVDYDGITLQISYSESDVKPASPQLTQQIDLRSLLGSSAVQMGFTAGTGAAWENQDILFWNLNGSKVDFAQSGVVNGDFSAGNSGFLSDYSYVTAIYSQTQYTVVPASQIDASQRYAPNSWTAVSSDPFGGNGNVLLADGATTANQRVWYEQVSVTPNTNYVFSFYGVDVNNHHENDAILQASINLSRVRPFTPRALGCKRVFSGIRAQARQLC